MKKSTTGYSRIIVILLFIFLAEMGLLFFQFNDAGSQIIQILMGLTGLTVIMIGYFIARFRGRDWKRNGNYQ